eukprot:10130030-Prorocentrum_lima.AAC.1
MDRGGMDGCLEVCLADGIGGVVLVKGVIRAQPTCPFSFCHSHSRACCPCPGLSALELPLLFSGKHAVLLRIPTLVPCNKTDPCTVVGVETS